MREKIIIVVMSAVLALGGNYAFQIILREQAKPVLLKDVYRPDLSNLPQQIQQQVPLVPIKYSLKHNGGNVAKNLTIWIKSDSNLAIVELRFTPDSEVYQCTQSDPRSIKVDVPKIRPNGFVSFDMMTSVNNQVNFTELSEDAEVLTLKEFEARMQKTSITQVISIVGIIAGIVLWVLLIYIACIVLWRTGKWWQDMESGISRPELKKRLIVFIVALLMYNVAVSSLGPVSGFLPVPRLSFESLFYAFLLYLLITRYKLLDDWLYSKKRIAPRPKTKTKKESRG